MTYLDNPVFADAPPQHEERQGATPTLARDMQNLFTGVAISGKIALLATICVSQTGITFRPELSCTLELQDRSQDYIRKCGRELAAWCIGAGTQRILLRTAPNAGPYLSRAVTYKLEALLQLVGSMHVELIDGGALTRWMNVHEPALPQLSRSECQVPRHQVTWALGAAACAAFRAGVPVVSSDHAS
jgi:hypothetical protein